MKHQPNHFLPRLPLKRRSGMLLVALMIATAISGTLSACGTKILQSAESSVSSSSASSIGDAVSSAAASTLSFSDLACLLGMTQDEVISAVGETPVAVDEGGLGFDQTGVRVWFDEDSHTKVAQVLIMTNAFDLNGVRVGDPFSSFKEVFGEPISDSDGDAHFKYNDIYLSVVRDNSSDSGKTIGVYLLQEDF